MARESYAQLTDDRIREVDTLSAYGAGGEYFGQFIHSMSNPRAPGAPPYEMKSIDLTIDEGQLLELAQRVKKVRGSINPEGEKHLG